MRIRKVEPEGRTVRTGPCFSKIKVPPNGLTFSVLTNDSMFDYCVGISVSKDIVVLKCKLV